MGRGPQQRTKTRHANTRGTPAESNRRTSDNCRGRTSKRQQREADDAAAAAAVADGEESDTRIEADRCRCACRVDPSRTGSGERAERERSSGQLRASARLGGAWTARGGNAGACDSDATLMRRVRAFLARCSASVHLRPLSSPAPPAPRSAALVPAALLPSRDHVCCSPPLPH